MLITLTLCHVLSLVLAYRYTPAWITGKVYFGGVCHCAKFGSNLSRSYDNMQVLIF